MRNVHQSRLMDADIAGHQDASWIRNGRAEIGVACAAAARRLFHKDEEKTAETAQNLKLQISCIRRGGRAETALPK